MVPCALADNYYSPRPSSARFFGSRRWSGPWPLILESLLSTGLFFEACQRMEPVGAAFIFVGARYRPGYRRLAAATSPRGAFMRTYNQLYPAADRHDLATEERDKRLLGTMTFHPCRAALTASRAGRSEARFGCWPSAHTQELAGDVAGDCGPVSHSEAPLTRMKRVVAPREYSGSRVRGAQGTPLALRTGKYTLSEKCTPGSFGLSVAYACA